MTICWRHVIPTCTRLLDLFLRYEFSNLFCNLLQRERDVFFLVLLLRLHMILHHTVISCRLYEYVTGKNSASQSNRDLGDNRYLVLWKIFLWSVHVQPAQLFDILPELALSKTQQFCHTQHASDGALDLPTRTRVLCIREENIHVTRQKHHLICTSWPCLTRPVHHPLRTFLLRLSEGQPCRTHWSSRGYEGCSCPEIWSASA